MTKINASTTYEQVALTDDEQSLLMTIYNTRARYAALFYAFILALIAFYSITRVRGNNSYMGYPGGLVAKQQLIQSNSLGYSRSKSKWNDKNNADAKVISEHGMMLIAFSFLAIPTLITCGYYFRKKVMPYKKDSLNGVKNKVPYVIRKKEYFEFTGQYYFGFDDPNYLHHQVEAELFNQCNVGDVVYLFRAPLSGYTFEMNGRFTL